MARRVIPITGEWKTYDFALEWAEKVAKNWAGDRPYKLEFAGATWNSTRFAFDVQFNIIMEL